MNTHDIELPPLHYDELPEYGDAIPAMHSYARKAIEADRQRRGEPYNYKRIGWELERTAMGDGFYGNALRVAKDIPGVSSEDRAVLDRYATGKQQGTDHIALQNIALNIYMTPQPATPVIKESLTVAEPAQEVIEAYDAIDNFLRNNLYDDDYALYSKALDDVFSYGQPAQPAASAEPIGYITPAAIDLLREGRYVTLCPTSIDQGVPVFLGAELAASVGPTRCGDCPPDDEFAEDLARIDDELGIDTWEFDPGVTLEAIRELKKYVEMLEAAPVAQEPWQSLAAALYQAAGAYDMPVRFLDVLSAAANGEPFAHLIDGLLPVEPPVAQEPVAFLCRECDEEGWSTYAVMPHEVPSTGEFLHVEPLYASPVAAQAPVIVNQQMTTDLLERVSDALGRFVSDEGWTQADMDLCDEFSAALAVLSSVQDREDAGDPLQGAANWLVEALVDCGPADLQNRLLIAHNRACRLLDAAIDAARAAKEKS
ncbi:MAG: hypothetical protein WCX93_00310 [Burkholderiaceae bacterium]